LLSVPDFTRRRRDCQATCLLYRIHHLFP
jgi:hypothetical protein